MRRTLIAVLSAATVLTGVVPAMAQDLPATTAAVSAFAPLMPLIGKTWRGVNAGNADVIDVAHWDWAVGGHAVRVVHSVNDGAYGGETLIFPDKDSGELIFHYFTTGGFHTTGTMRPRGNGVIEIVEAVHGADGIESLKSRATFNADGTWRTRALVEQDGVWVEFGGFDYVQAPEAAVRLPMRAGVETPVSVGGLTLSRRIVREAAAGEDVAGYLKIENAAEAGDQLVSATCACARDVEFHHIRRTANGASMDDDPVWDAPGRGVLAVRPGSDLHLMLLAYDPSQARDGRVRLTLTFRDAGAVEADFALTQDSAAAWQAFD